MKNLFFVEVIYVSILGRNCTQGPKQNKDKTLTLVIKAKHLTLIFVLDFELFRSLLYLILRVLTSDHLGA